MEPRLYSRMHAFEWGTSVYRAVSQ